MYHTMPILLPSWGMVYLVVCPNDSWPRINLHSILPWFPTVDKSGNLFDPEYWHLWLSVWIQNASGISRVFIPFLLICVTEPSPVFLLRYTELRTLIKMDDQWEQTGFSSPRRSLHGLPICAAAVTRNKKIALKRLQTLRKDWKILPFISR